MSRLLDCRVFCCTTPARDYWSRLTGSATESLFAEKRRTEIEFRPVGVVPEPAREMAQNGAHEGRAEAAGGRGGPARRQGEQRSGAHSIKHARRATD